jgi:hypothetical protein
VKKIDSTLFAEFSGAAKNAKQKRQEQSKARKALREQKKNNAPKKAAKGTTKPRVAVKKKPKT